MTVSRLDARTALVVIDLQRGIVGRVADADAERVVDAAKRLAAAFRRRGLPVVWMNVAGRPPGRTERPLMSGEPPAGFAELLPGLCLPGDHALTKHGPGAFIGTGLGALLAGLRVTQIVLAGISTSVGVESTARQAYEHGFNVTLASDAMTDPDAQAHAASVTRVFPVLGETGATEAIIALIERDLA